MTLPKPLSLSHQFLRGAISPGDRVVDATLGNGYDTAFLAGLVGPEGRVTGFDVQADALVATRERLGDLAGRCELVHAGHETMAQKVRGGVAAVVFNLGYLPGADKELVTQRETTLAALEQAAGLLKVRGVLSVMCYPGHAGGAEEVAAVKEWFAGLGRREWRVFEYSALNAPNSPPSLLVGEKVGL